MLLTLQFHVFSVCNPDMLAKNMTYNVVEILNVSESLSKQLQTKNENKNGIYKSILQNKETNHIVYFIDGINFGSGTVLEILNTQNEPILYKNDYKIVTHCPFAVNYNFLQKLYGKNKLKQSKNV